MGQYTFGQGLGDVKSGRHLWAKVIGGDKIRMTAADYNPESDYKEVDEPAYTTGADINGMTAINIQLEQDIMDLKAQLALVQTTAYHANAALTASRGSPSSRISIDAFVSSLTVNLKNRIFDRIVEAFAVQNPQPLGPLSHWPQYHSCISSLPLRNIPILAAVPWVLQVTVALLTRIYLYAPRSARESDGDYSSVGTRRPSTKMRSQHPPLY